MSHFSTQLFKALSSGTSFDEIFRQELEQALNELLKTELTVFLDYEPYDPIGYNSGNSRNGYYQRTLATKYGDVHLSIPRDRLGQFNQQTIPSYARRTSDLETTILQLYRKGITTAEIADLIEKMYGHAYTPQTISNLTVAVEEQVKQFHQRPLNHRYSVIIADATMLCVRRDSVSKEALHQACWVHLQRNVARLVRAKDRKEILEQLKPVYQASTPLEAAETLSEFLCSVQSKYPKIIRLFENKPNLFNFLHFPKAIQRSLYTTNLIEGLNKHLKRSIKRKAQCPNESSLDWFIYHYFSDCNRKFTQRIHKGFDIVQHEINELFEATYA